MRRTPDYAARAAYYFAHADMAADAGDYRARARYRRRALLAIRAACDGARA